VSISSSKNGRVFLMLTTFAFLVLLLGTTNRGQEREVVIDDIEFFGTSGIEVGKLKSALPVKEGQKVSVDEMPDLVAQIRASIKTQTRKEATDVNTTCCTAQRNWIVYIGLPGKNFASFHYNSRPTGKQRFPDEVATLYRDTLNLLVESLQKPGVDATEDRSKGYALSAYPPLRTKQLAMRDYATHNENLIRRVLQESSDSEQRAIAAQLLGYAERSEQQVRNLVHAARDPDDGVRNNAVRALGVLASSSAQTADEIPAADFVQMLNSGIWKDRNKAGLLLSVLTLGRDQRLLSLLRQQASDSLLEMAHWREPGHAINSLVIIGRIAGIEEDRLTELIVKNDREAITKEFLRKQIN
jgi:hypothetical protein